MKIDKTTPPRVYIVAEDGREVEIGYACEFDFDTGDITLPENLPAGSRVFVDGEFLIETAMPIVPRNMVKTSLRMNVLSAAIGAALYAG